MEVSQMRDDWSLNKSEYSRVNTPLLFERMSSKDINIYNDDEISPGEGNTFLLPEDQRRVFPSHVVTVSQVHGLIVSSLLRKYRTCFCLF
jgi:hypothetical protein